MKAAHVKVRNGQAGFTLVELLVSLALSLFVVTALTSVVFTSVRASNVAIGRIEASGQIRNFQLRADDDFAGSAAPSPSGCGIQPEPACQTAPIVLNGVQVSNSTSPIPSPVTITFLWDGSANLDRIVGSNSTHMATSVTAFSWYVDSSTQTVVVQITVTVLSYSESQTLVFHPRLTG